MLRRILSTVLALSICLLSVSPFCTALGRPVLDTPAEEQLVNVKTEKQTFLTFAFTLFSTAFTVAEIIGKTTNAVEAGKRAHEEGGSVLDVAGAAGSSLLELDDDKPGVDPEELDEMNKKLDSILSNVSAMNSALSSEIQTVNSKLDSLYASLEKVNQSLNDIHNTIIAEGNKAYINDFRVAYYDLMNDLILEYNDLIEALKTSGDDIDSIKRSYDDLYIAASRASDKLAAYINGSYHTDGTSIQDVMFEYSSYNDVKTVDAKCSQFATDIYSSFVVSQYCLMICKLYQLTYLGFYELNDYVTENEAPESIPAARIAGSFEDMQSSYLKTFASVISFLCDHADYGEVPVMYYPAAVDTIFTAPFDKLLETPLTKGDKLEIPLPIDRKTMTILGENDWYDVSVSNNFARVNSDGTVEVLRTTGSFDVTVDYQGMNIATYSFTIGDAPFSGGFGTETAPYLIGTADDVLALSTAPADAHYRMIADVDMGEEQVRVAIMPELKGSFDGNGHTLSNLTIIRRSADAGAAVGLFGTNSGIISNFNVESVTVDYEGTFPETGNVGVGVLVGNNTKNGRIVNCSVITSNVDLTSNNNVGYIRWEDPEEIIGIGGVAGYNSGKVYSCLLVGIKLVSTVKYDRMANEGKYASVWQGALIGYTQGDDKNVRKNYVKSYTISVSEYYLKDMDFGGSMGGLIGNHGNAPDCGVVGNGMNFTYGMIYKVDSGYGSTFPTFEKKPTNTSIPVPDDPALYGQYGLCLDENGEVTLDRNVYESVEVLGAQDTFYLGDSFTLGGGKLVLTYKNGSKQTVPITSLEGFDTSVSGEGRVRATYVPPYGDPISAEYTINVNCLHVWSDMGVVTEPTHLTEGEQNYGCKHCGEERTVSVEKKAEHTFTDFIPIGNNGHKPICECGEDILLEHEYDEGAVILFPTYFASGVSVFTCTDCGFEKRESTPPIQNDIPAGAPVISGSSSYATSGKTVKVSFDLNSNPGISFLLVTLEFDTAALTLVGVENGEVLGNLESGLNLVWDAASDSTMNGNLVTLTFAVNDGTEGTYKVTPVFREAYDSANRPVAVYTLPANVRVAELTHGDANADGRVSGVDLVILRNYLANLDFDSDVSTVGVNLGADCNGDGEINGKDLLLLRKYMANYDYNTGESTVVLGPAGGASND